MPYKDKRKQADASARFYIDNYDLVLWRKSMRAHLMARAEGWRQAPSSLKRRVLKLPSNASGELCATVELLKDLKEEIKEMRRGPNRTE